MVELHRQNLKYNKKKYKEVKKRLRTRINKNMPIEHIGSTILPNMYGKNIIDILVGVNEENEMDKYSDILIELGYFPGNHNSGNYRFFASTKEETKMGDVHIHLVYIDSDRYRDFITLRDYLLSNKEERKAYSDLKRKLISDGTNIREDYKVTKSKYVSDLLIRARKYMKNNY
ncbi:MAG: GrpB family protein [Bacilli bacterium]|nr:GrpB family protein [Bacilli bacterium]